MANKALAKRQKMTLRTEPSRPALKPRNPLVVPARQRVAGPHKQTASGQRQQQQRDLDQLLIDAKKTKE
ncbi:MAG: hypothetical protein JSS58_10340 [Proteobacteria bacterium]|nr:hypothetical protein [Pseudomonadota bacterium]